MSAITAPLDHEEFTVVVGSYRIAPEDVAAFVDIAKKMHAYSTAAKGNLFFSVAEDVAEPGLLRLCEGWADQAALYAHAETQGFKDLTAEARKLNILGTNIYVTTAKGWVSPL